MQEINTENLTAYSLLLLNRIIIFKSNLTVCKRWNTKYLSTVLFFFPKPSSVNTDISAIFFCLLSQRCKLTVFVGTESGYNYPLFPQFLSLSTHNPYFSFGLKIYPALHKLQVSMLAGLTQSHEVRFTLTAPRFLSCCWLLTPEAWQTVREVLQTIPPLPAWGSRAPSFIANTSASKAICAPAAFVQLRASPSISEIASTKQQHESSGSSAQGICCCL